MKDIIVKTQKELDHIDLGHNGYIYIEGGTKEAPLNLCTNFQYATLVVRGSAYLQNVSGSAQIRYVYGSAQIRYVSGSAQIELTGEAIVSAHSAKKIVCKGYNTVIVHKADRSKIGLVLGKNAHLVILPDDTLATKPSFKEFTARYPFDTKGKTAILYKAVHKKDGKYISDYVSSFEYAIGEVKKETCDPAGKGSCSRGLHVSPKYWASRFGESWNDMALLECEVPIKSIVVSSDTDGKVRTSQLKVIREVPKEEYWK